MGLPPYEQEGFLAENRLWSWIRRGLLAGLVHGWYWLNRLQTDRERRIQALFNSELITHNCICRGNWSPPSLILLRRGYEELAHRPPSAEADFGRRRPKPWRRLAERAGI